MLLANEETVMTVIDTLNFVAFYPFQNNNPIAVRRRKLIAKIDEQTQLPANKDYTPAQHKWGTDEMVLNVKWKLLNVLSVGGL
tara:strand:- start:97 stop:345 length:249 start_codon:yes stop_codon:yes gene_type:complete